MIEKKPTADEDVSQSTGRGIFDCEDAYRTPIRADYERVFGSGLIALDTNVLLNLYRSNERTRNDIFAALQKLRERLWIPHHVLTEFWRNRDLPSVRGHHRTKAKETCAALDKSSRSIRDALERWLRDVHLNSDEEVCQHIDRAKEELAKTMEDLKSFIQGQAEKDALEGTAATHTDPVLKKLEQLLEGRVGEPYSDADFRSAVTEAQRRADERIAPGYEDFQNKPQEQAAGDYIIWSQILEEAERRRCDVLLVTGDVKEDWWISGGGPVPARPRTDLSAELRQRAGVKLLMLTPSQLLFEANDIFGLQVDERSVSDLVTIESKTNRFGLPAAFVHSIPERLHIAHARAAAAIRATIATEDRAAYGSTLWATVLEELREEAAAFGGTFYKLRGIQYPVLNNRIIMPFKYSSYPISFQEILEFWENNEGREENSRDTRRLSKFEKSLQPYHELRTTLAEHPKKAIAVICYSSSPNYGINAIYLAATLAARNGKMVWNYIEELPTITS